VNALHGVWGPRADDVWVVGDAGTILHRTAAGWVPSPSGTARNLWSLAGTSDGEVWAVGAAGTILHRPSR